MKYLFFLIPVLLILSLAVSTEAFAEPTKIKHEGGGEVWDLYGNSTLVYQSSAPYVFNNATIYGDGDNTWVSIDVDDLGGGDFDILSGRIGTKFLGETVTHYNIKTGIDVGTEKINLMRLNTVFENVPLTFVDRTSSESFDPVSQDVAGISVTDIIHSVTITENWSSAFGDMVIDYLFVEGQPLKHTFTFTQTSSGSETYQLHHEFDLITEEIEIESEGNASSDIQNIKLKVKQDDIKLKIKFTNGTEIEQEPETSLIVDKSTFDTILRVMEFNTDTPANELLLGEIIAPSTTHPAWDDFIELFIDATSDPIFFFRYGNYTITQSQSFQLDPDTYSEDNPAQDGYHTKTDCTGAVSPNTSATVLRIGLDGSDNCQRTAIEWDITSISNSAIVSDTRFKFEVQDVLGTADRPCDFYEMAGQPTVQSSASSYNDAGDGTLFVNNDAKCQTAATNYNLDLGGDADTDVESQLSLDWWALGIKLDDESGSPQRNPRLASEENATPVPKPTLEVTFSINPTYVVDLLDVYESSSTTLDSGTSVCLNVDLESASSCGTALNAGSTYRFEIEVDNTGAGDGTPTSFDLDAMIAASDVLGSIPVGNLLDSGCSTNTNWAESISGGTDARASSGTTCLIANTTGSVEFWMVVTLDTDANNGTGTFTITDGTTSDTSTTTTFTVNSAPLYTLTSLDVYESGTRALGDGTVICTNVDLTSPSACSGNLVSGNTYQFQVNVTNTGQQAGSPTSEEFRDVVAVDDVLGTIPVTSLDTGCDDDGVDRIWTDSIVTDDAVGTSGTTCTIEANTGFEIYYWIVTLDPDSDDASGTFYVTDGTNSDVSSSTTFSLNPSPNPVTDLVASNPTFSTVDLGWSEPDLNGGTLEGYQINFTMPFGEPLSVIVNNTGTPSITSYVVGNLVTATDYSFRVSAWTNFGNNAGGNIANSTTTGEEFAVGQITINQTNPNIIDIRFERTEVDATTTRIDVLYDNTFNLTCTLDHKFARTSQNYSNLDIVPFDPSTSNSSFVFGNHTNDLVDMYCYNENDLTEDGRFQVTWSNFPLLDQFANFRSGEYGTQGLFGVIDFITLGVIIFSMIGLNRINESVGIIFNIILLGALAYFGIIELPTIIFGALVVVLIFGVASTRKK